MQSQMLWHIVSATMSLPAVRFAALSSLCFALACSGEDPPAPPGPGSDSGTAQLCDPQNPCPLGNDCVGGVCQPAQQGNDASVTPRAQLEVCTPDGCISPYRLSFGGSRIGVSTTRNLTLRSAGELPLEIRSL